MKLRLYSDLHREFDGWEIPIKDNEEDYVLVLAGDIGVARKEGTYVDFLLDAAARFKHVVYVPGNHEYYGDSFDRAWDKIKGWFDGVDNLHFLNMDMVEVEDVRILGCTLWTDMDDHSEVTMFTAGQRMNDYRAINRLTETDTDDGWAYRGKLTPAHTIATHYAHKMWLDDQLYQAERDGVRTLVVTHHGPTLRSIGYDFIGDELNGAYVTDLTQLIHDRNPTAWVHGHVHDTKLYTEAQTLVATNPKGYPYRLAWRTDSDREFENERFRTDGVIPELNELFN